MSTSATPASDAQIEVIDPSAILSIPCSPGFFQRMQQLAGFLIEGKTKAEIEEMQQQIKQNKTKSGTWQHHYETLVAFCAEFEKAVRAAGKSSKVTPEEFQRLLSQQGS